MNPRSEPLLWLQLVALGAIPLEVLGLFLVLAGADPGPFPYLERGLAWGLGGLAPALVLARRPADCFSLLLAKVPLAARSQQQRCLASLQVIPLTRWSPLLGAGLLLPLFWRLDNLAAIAAPLSPIENGNRLVTLMAAIPFLALLVWQWQQLIQSLWLLTRSADALSASTPLDRSAMEHERLCPGLPLLLIEPLQIAMAREIKEPSGNQESNLRDASSDIASAVSGVATTAGPVTVEPEQAPEEENSDQLNR